MNTYRLATRSLIIVWIGTTIFVTACSQKAVTGGPDEPKPTTGAKQSVTEYKGGPADLLIQDLNTGTTDAQFQKFFVEPIKAKYPQINLTKTGDSLEKLLAAGTPPDMVLVSNPSLGLALEVDIPEDLTQMIKTYGIDLQRFQPAIVEQMHKLGENKAFYGIPFAMNYGVLTYNKDIFDKFGVPYPKDVNTWDELYELAKRLTRTESNVNYIGILPSALSSMYWQYGVPVFDKAKNAAVLTTDQHVKVFTLLKQFYSIPGYMEKTTYAHSSNLFFKEFRMAMYPGWIAALISTFATSGTKDSFNWDLAAHPTFSDKPSYGKEIDFHMAVVNKSSKNREAAYQVLLSISSDEVQTKISKAGRVTVLKNNDILNVFGEESGLFEGKNLKSIFKVNPAPLPEASKFDAKINSLLNGEVVKDVMVDGTDINSALRKGQDKANKEIVNVQ